jgi:DNA-binding response OmpR family regulator
VLIVDDDPDVRRLIASIAEEEGYAVVAVADGREAYRQLMSDANFGVVILDMMMPHLKGVDIARYMRTEKRLMRIPVIMITGGDGLELMAESFSAGAVAFLPKPFAPERLQNALRLFLNKDNLKRSAFRQHG